MNARKLKQAFIQMLPVFTTDKDNPIKNGYIKTVIFTLGSSGKVRCDAEVQDLDSAKNFSKTPCRRIHFKSDDVKIKDAAASTNEHAESVKKAFVNVEPVIADVPGMNVVKCSHIIAIVYTRGQRGNIICSAILQDANCPSSTLQVRIKYIFTPSEYENIEKEHWDDKHNSVLKGQKWTVKEIHYNNYNTQFQINQEKERSKWVI